MTDNEGRSLPHADRTLSRVQLTRPFAPSMEVTSCSLTACVDDIIGVVRLIGACLERILYTSDQP